MVCLQNGIINNSTNQHSMHEIITFQSQKYKIVAWIGLWWKKNEFDCDALLVCCIEPKQSTTIRQTMIGAMCAIMSSMCDGDNSGCCEKVSTVILINGQCRTVERQFMPRVVAVIIVHSVTFCFGIFICRCFSSSETTNQIWFIYVTSSYHDTAT